MARDVKPWNRLLRGVVESPSLEEGFKTGEDVALEDMVWQCWGSGWVILKVFSNLNHSMIQ